MASIEAENGPTYVEQSIDIKIVLWSVIKRHVQFYLTASLTARVHGKVRSLSESSWHVQPITEQSYQLRIQLQFA